MMIKTLNYCLIIFRKAKKVAILTLLRRWRKEKHPCMTVWSSFQSLKFFNKITSGIAPSVKTMCWRKSKCTFTKLQQSSFFVWRGSKGKSISRKSIICKFLFIQNGGLPSWRVRPVLVCDEPHTAWPRYCRRRNGVVNFIVWFVRNLKSFWINRGGTLHSLLQVMI